MHPLVESRVNKPDNKEARLQEREANHKYTLSRTNN